MDDDWNESPADFAAEWLKDSQRDEVIYEIENRRGKFRLTTTAIEALQAENAKLRGELIGREMVRQDHARIAALEAELAGAREAAHNLREAFRLFPEAHDTLTRAELRAAKGNWRSLIDQQTNAINAALKAAQP